MTDTKTAAKPAAKKTAAKRPAAPKGGKYNVADLPTEGKGQYRQGGEYKEALRAIGTFAKDDETNKARHKALVHLGWVRLGGKNTKSGSAAFDEADKAGLPSEAWAVDEDAAPQIAANVNALAEAGAPVEHLDALWAAYVGAGSDVL